MNMVWEWTKICATVEDVKSCVGSGWHAIIDRLVKDLEALRWNGVVTQVKEKFGGLRFYIGGGSTAIFERISQAEEESLRTCEFCGKPGEPDSWGQFWILTLCPECGEKRRNGGSRG